MLSRPVLPQLSVIVTSRDAGPWIRETLESVLAQSHTDFELVVVDADSQDETPEIVAELADADLRVRVVHAKRMSGSRARDVGVSVARGRYLVFCDGSDLVAEHGFDALMAATTDSPDIVVGDFLTFSSGGTRHPHAGSPLFSTTSGATTLSGTVALLQLRTTWGKAFRTAFWHQHRLVFPEASVASDLVPMTRAFGLAHDIRLVPDIVHLHRELPQASTTARLLHHLGQEIVSAEALERLSTQAVRRRHALMITDAPAWEQVEEHLEHGPDDPEVADRLRTLVTLIDSSDVPAIKSRRRRLILALCELGEVPLAARALQLTAPTPPRPDRSWLASWSDVLRAVPDEGHRLISHQEIADIWIRRGLRKSLLARSPRAWLPTDDLARLLDELPRSTLTTSGPMASLNLRLGLALTSLHDGDRAAADRLQRHRHTRATLDDQNASRFYEHLSGTVDSPEPVTIDSIATVTDHLGLRKVGRARLTSGRAAAGGTTRPWKARVPSRALTSGRAALVLIGRDQSGGEMIIALKTGVEADRATGSR